MEEKEFMKLCGDKIDIPIYYGFDENDNVILDWDSMKEAFDEEVNKLQGFLE